MSPRLAAAAIAAGTILCCSAPAGAGTYDVPSCQAPGANGQNNAWTLHVTAYPGVEPQPTAYATAQECQPGGRGLYAESTGPAEARFLTSAYYQVDAPAGAHIVALSATRSGDKQRLDPAATTGDGWSVSANADGNVVVGGVFGETCSIPATAASCSLPGTAAGPYPLNTSHISYGIACVRSDGTSPFNCPVVANGVPAARLSLRATVVTISDDSAPALQAAGSLLGGGWVPASAFVTASATDNVGIKTLRLLVDGATRADASPACDFTRPLPCPDVGATRLDLGAADLGDGAHTVTVLAEDSAGNPARVDQQAQIDFHPPTVTPSLPPGGRVSAAVADAASGVAQVVIAARDDRGGPARTLVLGRLRDGRVSGPSSIPARHLLLHITARDRAGNERVEDGRPAVIAIGLSRVGTRNRVPRDNRLRVGFRQSVTLSGRLRDSANRGVGGQAITATTTAAMVGAPRLPIGAATTDAKGRFSLRVPAGVSRTVRLAFDGGGGALRMVRGISLRVPAGTTLRASRRRVRGARRVAFRGQVAARGQAVPRGGLTVLLQGREGRAWQTFSAVHTDRLGRWRASYRFSGRPGRFAIRALVRRSPSFPFDDGASRSVRVTVRR